LLQIVERHEAFQLSDTDTWDVLHDSGRDHWMWAPNPIELGFERPLEVPYVHRAVRAQ
jgi:hypothetical protein